MASLIIRYMFDFGDPFGAPKLHNNLSLGATHPYKGRAAALHLGLTSAASRISLLICIFRHWQLSANLTSTLKYAS